MNIKKIFGILLLILGGVGLVLGVLGIFDQEVVAMSPWALAILGLIFFFSGVSLMKRIRV